MKRGWALLALFADSNLLFVLCSVLLLLGWWRHRLERRRRLRALHEQESFEDAVRAHATLPAADGDACMAVRHRLIIRSFRESRRA